MTEALTPLPHQIGLMKNLIRHHRFKECDFLRDRYAYQVEIEDWGCRSVRAGPGYLDSIHDAYDSGASWPDHPGARTFGFAGKNAAQRFVDEQGGQWVKGEND